MVPVVEVIEKYGCCFARVNSLLRDCILSKEASIWADIAHKHRLVVEIERLKLKKKER